MRNKKILMIIASITLILIIILSSSYAYLRVEKKSGNQNISIANFGLVIKEDMKAITLNNEVPKSDEDGLKNTPNTFTIENQGNITAKYRVSLIDSTIQSTMSNLDIRYQVKKTRTSGSEIEEVKGLGADGVFDEGVIAPSEEISFELVIWINYDANPNGLTYSKILSLEGLQADTLDTSGANPPEMLDNMIPVYYSKTSDTEGVWKKADITNRDESHKWYDYNDFMWANSVTVKESNGILNADGTMTFDGVDDYYDLGHADYDFKDRISIIIRMKLNKYATEKHQAFLGSGNCLAAGEEPNHRLYFSLYIGDFWKQINSNEIADLDTWYIIVGTYDGKAMKLYINGKLVQSINITGNINSLSESIYLGKLNKDGGQIANGVVSDALIYTDTLTDDEVSKYFSGEITDYPKDNLLVAKTEFNELDTRQKYLEASAGTEVKMEDISSMWVWIPRYKYTIFNGNNETADEQMINIEFEKGIESTGTVSCHDDIQADDNSDHSEICTDEKNKGIKNGVSTYTHPAFTFGEEELVGFWFAKFEMGTEDESCLSDQSNNCNKTGIDIYVKPDEISLRHIAVSNSFANLRSMELYGNIHGFPQSKNATSYLDTKGNLSGEIPNDSNNYDIHMMKNMEWGAVTYLTMSKYGKYGNSLYKDEYKEVYKNNYRTGTADNNYILKTGYSAKVPIGDVGDSNTALYNNLTIEQEGQGYIGAGASTTGTVYGIYDMSGGAWEQVMANMIDTSNNFSPALAETWSTTNKPLDKYYDKYSYNVKINSNKTRGKLGDATKEIIKDFNNQRNGAWYNDFSDLQHSDSNRYWLGRGGIAFNLDEQVGIFHFGEYTGAGNLYRDTSRPVLTISRDFPWKDN